MKLIGKYIKNYNEASEETRRTRGETREVELIAQTILLSEQN